MSSVPCINCGAAITPGTKFCRRCGQASLDAASVSEASTRIFEATAERASPTQTWNAQPTGPAYMAPGAASPLRDATTTRGLEPTAGRGRQKTWLFVSLIGLLLVAAIAFLTLAMLKAGRTMSSTTAPPQTPPAATAPGTDLPQPPPPPPPPFEEQPAQGPTIPTSQLVYPGSETVLDMKTGRDNMMQLRTNDASNKVIDWYVEKLKPTQTIRGTGAEAVLRTGRTMVIISGRGEATEIIIKQGMER
ncbi:MAG TPA: zinc ribbon domain-containing protein [Pyrinomonadaceae bacterium]|nr:zinc ribbon domain-containing protein [Pyrinomonadaceae bacterium]